MVRVIAPGQKKLGRTSPGTFLAKKEERNGPQTIVTLTVGWLGQGEGVWEKGGRPRGREDLENNVKN